MMVRCQGMLTQLLFDHALRIRVKAEAHKDSSASATSTAAHTPDTASVVDASESRSDSGEEASGSVHSGASTAAGTTKGKQREPSAFSISSSSTKIDKEKEKSDDSSKEGNLAGRLNNLATTDMEALVNGRDFLFIGERNKNFILPMCTKSVAVLYIPVQLFLCCVFLYRILGWRYDI